MTRDMPARAIMTQTPRVSVVMSVYNNVADLPRAMEGLLAQTFADFELVCIDDGSTDGSGDMLAWYAARDPRVRVITQANAGLGRALARGCAAARGEYVARHDADDASPPTRLARQVAYLDARADFAGCGTWAWMIHPDRGTVGVWEVPDDPMLVRRLLARGSNPIVHGSVMMRRDAYERAGGYRFARLCEDLDMWMRLVEVGPMGSVPSPEYAYWLNGSGITVTQFDDQQTMTRLCVTLAAERAQRGRETTDFRAAEAALAQRGAGSAPPAERATTVEYAQAIAALRAGDGAAFRTHLASAACGTGPLARRARILRRLAWAAPALRAAQRWRHRGGAWRHVRTPVGGLPMPNFLPPLEALAAASRDAWRRR